MSQHWRKVVCNFRLTGTHLNCQELHENVTVCDHFYDVSYIGQNVLKLSFLQHWGRLYLLCYYFSGVPKATSPPRLLYSWWCW